MKPLRTNNIIRSVLMALGSTTNLADLAALCLALVTVCVFPPPKADSYPYYLAFISADEDDIVYCISFEEAITVHPADATWLCKSGSAGSAPQSPTLCEHRG